MAAGGQAVFELAPQGVAGEDIIAPKNEPEWMQRLGAETDRAISFGMIQVTPPRIFGASSWKRLADPPVKAAIVSEHDLAPDPNRLFDNMFALAQYSLGRLYALGDPPITSRPTIAPWRKSPPSEVRIHRQCSATSCSNPTPRRC